MEGALAFWITSTTSRGKPSPNKCSRSRAKQLGSTFEELDGRFLPSPVSAGRGATAEAMASLTKENSGPRTMFVLASSGPPGLPAPFPPSPCLTPAVTGEKDKSHIADSVASGELECCSSWGDCHSKWRTTVRSGSFCNVLSTALRSNIGHREQLSFLGTRKLGSVLARGIVRMRSSNS